MKLNVIENIEPLQADYTPEEVVDREAETKHLSTCMETISEGHSQNILLHGPPGTGKTLLLQKVVKELDSVNVIWVSCREYDTQYKVLKQICQVVTGEDAKTGFHTSELQRRIQERTTQVSTLVVLDDVDFLLLNDGNDLLYYLSRTNPDKMSLAVVSSSSKNFSELVEERTYSTLYPEIIKFEPYTSEEVYQILAQRARASLEPQSLQQEALTQISETTHNPAVGLEWLKTAAEQTDDAIHQEEVASCYDVGLRNHAYEQLNGFSPHHRFLYQAIEELSEKGSVTSSGKVYKQYQKVCKAQSEEPLSNRRISDYLKQLEQLNLIKAEYHYGGRKGKTREIRLKSL